MIGPRVRRVPAAPLRRGCWSQEGDQALSGVYVARAGLLQRYPMPPRRETRLRRVAGSDEAVAGLQAGAVAPRGRRLGALAFRLHLDQLQGPITRPHPEGGRVERPRRKAGRG